MNAASDMRPVPQHAASSVSFSGKSLAAALLLSSAVYGVSFLAAWLLSASAVPDAVPLVLVHLGAAVSCFTFWRLGRWGIAKYDSFGAALLLMSSLFRVQAAVDVLFFGTRVEAIPRTVPLSDPLIELLLKGELITQLGTLLVVSAWRFSVGRRIEEFSFLHGHGAVSKRLPWLVYAGALLIEVGRGFLGDLGGFAQLSTLTYSFGVVSVFFIAARQPTTFKRVAKAVALAVPMVLMALDVGMKENIFYPLIPAALLFWFGYRKLVPRAAAVTMGIAILALSQLYVHYVREVTWGAQAESVSTPALVSRFVSDLGGISVLEALDAISSRVNMTTAHAITVSLADRYGYVPGEVFGSIPASLIPRLIWPGKPVIQPGAMHTARIYGVDADLSEITSSTAAGFSTELYLGAGFLGLILGAVGFGWLLASAQKWTSAIVPGFGHLAFAFTAAYWALRFDEKHVVYAYTTVIFTAVFLWLVKQLSAAFGFRMESAER